MKIEQSKVKIIISQSDYERLMAARDVIVEMKETFYNKDLDDLEFYEELSSLEDSFDTFEYSFSETGLGQYAMEVN